MECIGKCWMIGFQILPYAGATFRACYSNRQPGNAIL